MRFFSYLWLRKPVFDNFPPLFNKVEDEVDEINSKVFGELEKKLQD